MSIKSKKYSQFLAYLLSSVLIASFLIGPEITSAHANQVTIRLNSVDNLSGVSMMQIATDPNNPPAAIPYQSVYTFETSATTLWIRVQDKALNWSSWSKVTVNGAPVTNPGYAGSSSPTPTITATSAPAPAPAGGGGGGGGGPKQTAAYFIVVDPANQGNVYSKSACVDVYSTDLFPQFKGQGCSKSDGLINLLLTDGGVTVRVYDAGYGSTYQVFHGKVENDTFTLEDAKYFAGTTRYAVYVLGANANLNSPSPTSKPSNSSTPEQSNTSSANTKSPTPAPTVYVTVTPTPITVIVSPSKSPTSISSTLPTASKTISIVATSKITAISSSAISLKAGTASKLKFNGLTKGSSVSVSIKSPSGAVQKLPATKISSTSYTSLGFKFSTKGTYVLTLSAGKVRKTLKISVK